MDNTKGKWNGHTSAEVRNRYMKKAYDRINLIVVKGQKQIIKSKADQAGQSMAEYICSALTAYGCPVSSKLTEDTQERELRHMSGSVAVEDYNE